MVEEEKKSNAPNTDATGKRTKESAGKSNTESGPQMIGGTHQFSKKPKFLKDRLDFFTNLYE
jgi:hypothetical protein